MVSGVFCAPAPIAQLAEAADLKSACCRFESDWGYCVCPFAPLFHLGSSQFFPSPCTPPPLVLSSEDSFPSPLTWAGARSAFALPFLLKIFVPIHPTTRCHPSQAELTSPSPFSSPRATSLLASHAVFSTFLHPGQRSSPSLFPRKSTPPSSIDEDGSEGAVKRRCQASDMAMPSRMSCSEVMIVEMTVPLVAALSRTRVTILLQMSAPPAITSWRPSGMKPSAAFTAMG